MAVVYRKDEETKSISKEQITTLKHKTLQAESGTSKITRSVFSTISDILSLFTFKVVTKHRQCKLYGHVLPSSGWLTGRHPKCADCGKAIKSPEELRKPTL